MPGEESDIEIRQIFELEDFAHLLAPEHRERAEQFHQHKGE